MFDSWIAAGSRMALVLLMCGALPAWAGADAGSAADCEPGLAERTAHQIQQRYDGIRDIRGDFEQTNESATFEGEPLMNPLAKRGKVVFAKPGKMRWTYTEPEPSTVVSDGATLWIHDVAGATVTRLEVTAGFLSGAAMQFMLGDGEILETFDVSTASCDATTVTLDLVPKQEATYERLGLVADRSSGDIVGTSVLDIFGNLTRIRFEHLEINRNPPAETFVFEVPEGTELIDYAASQGASGGRPAAAPGPDAQR